MRIQGIKNQPKTAKKKNLLLKPKSELLKKKRYFKNFLISEWFIKFKDKKSEKDETKNLKIFFC